MSGLAAVRPDSRILALHFRRTVPSYTLSHAVGYKALEAGLIDWDNYEAKLPYFQTNFRSSVELPILRDVALRSASLNVRRNRDLIDEVYTWQMPPDAQLRKRLRGSYKRVAKESGGELWQRRARGHL